jgi:hypothetical protein
MFYKCENTLHCCMCSHTHTPCLQCRVCSHTMLALLPVLPHHACNVACAPTPCLHCCVCSHTMLALLRVLPHHACNVACAPTPCLHCCVCSHTMHALLRVLPHHKIKADLTRGLLHLIAARLLANSSHVIIAPPPSWKIVWPSTTIERQKTNGTLL